MLERLLTHLVHVDAVGVGVDLVGGHIVEAAGEVDLHPVGEVSAVGQGQSEQFVPVPGQRVHDRSVGRGSRVGLHIGVFGTEEALGSLDGEVLGDIDVFAPAVVALAGIALGILVRQHRALCFQHGTRDEVLRGDHLERRTLTAQLEVEDLGDLRIDVGKRGLHRGFGHEYSPVASDVVGETA